MVTSQEHEVVHATDPNPLKIFLIGGIYGKDSTYREKIKITPETTLESGFKVLGHQVATFSHHDRIDFRDADIVHVHHMGPAALRIASDDSSAAFVYTSHDGPAMSQTPAEVSRWLASRFVMSRADAVVALTRREAQFQRETYPMAGALHVVIANGVDSCTYRYARKNGAGKNGPWRLLYVGQLIEGKGLDVLFRSIATVPAEIVLDLVFHTDKLEGRFRSLAEKLGLAGRVRFLGAKTPTELLDIYQSADLLVVPSKAESLPSVITEAMLCGTPVVSTDVGGIQDQIAHYGKLVPPGDAPVLAEAIGSVLENYAIFMTQSRAMSQYAQQNFSVKAMLENHLQLYRSLLEQKEPRRRMRILRRPLNAAAQLAVNVLCKT